MSRIFTLTALLAVTGFALGIAGCQSDTETGDEPETEAVSHDGQDQAEDAHDEHEGHDHAESTDVAESMAQLSEEDHALAEKQGVCPVSGSPLGGMGAPYKMVIQQRTVFLCCQGCEGAVKADPEKYLAKLDE